jgi:hypothetical protein
MGGTGMKPFKRIKARMAMTIATFVASALVTGGAALAGGLFQPAQAFGVVNGTIINPGVVPPGVVIRPCTKSDNASYGCNAAVSSSYEGWAHTESNSACGTGGLMCATLSTIQAWRWSSATGWQYAPIAVHRQVYVYPFSGSWSWIWTANTGWLAAHGSNLVINPY